MSNHIQKHHRSRALWFFVLILVVIGFSYVTAHKAPASYQNNACILLQSNHVWRQDLSNTQEKWGVPISVQLAIMEQESHFISSAAPVEAKVFGIPIHKSSAVGYAQAVNSTWQLYLKDTHQLSADRDSFVSASDFIGWFANQARDQAHIPSHNAYALYLAYHEGISGYLDKSYANKAWLKHVAWRVQIAANRYHRQLQHCS